MKKQLTAVAFLFVLAIFTTFLFPVKTLSGAGEYAVKNVLKHFEIPAWQTLHVAPEAETIRLKDQHGKSTIEFYTIKREATPGLKVRVEEECLVIDTDAMLQGEFGGNVQMQIHGLDPDRMADHDYCLYFNVQGPKNCTGKFYFEGYTLENKHFWRCKEVNFNGQVQRIAFDEFIPEGLRYLKLRYDFFGCGEFRLFSTRVILEEEAPSALRTAKPKLTFHATFDDETAVAKVANGDKNPKNAKNLKFSDDAVRGKSLEMREMERPTLEYLTQGNIRQEEGSISVWVKPDWNAGELNSWRTILTQPWEERTRIGSGALWCWVYNGLLRFDTSDLRDRYIVGNIHHENAWMHVVFTWDAFSMNMYVNGKRISNRVGDGRNSAQPVFPLRYDRTPYESFFVGCRNNFHTLNGNLDELRIYDKSLTEDEVRKLYCEFRPLTFVENSGTKCILDDAPHKTITGTVNSTASEPISGTIRLLGGNEILAEQNVTFVANGNTPFTLTVPATDAHITTPGVLSVVLFVGDERQASRPLAVLHAPHSEAEVEAQRKKIAKMSASKNLWTDELELKLLEEIDVTNAPAERFVCYGESAMSELAGKKYLEMDNKAGSRFALHLSKLEKGKVYCFEWDFPDDKMRTVDIIAQSALGTSGGEYELQTGYCTGDEYPNTGKWLTQRSLFWARSDDFALVFTSARTVTPINDGNIAGGAAVGKIRVYEVLNTELPVAIVNPARPVDGWTRPVGIYFEDPAINYDFGDNGSTDEGYALTLDRLCQYMKFSGQNLLAYPMVWYDGPIGERYNPRNHVPYFFEGILERFDREGLEFMGTFNQNNVSYDVPLLSRVDTLSGVMNNSEFTVHNTGTLHPGGWHGSPPIFNTLHPAVQAMTLRQFDDILANAARHPSFKGMILHLPRHALHSLGDIRAGYNNYLIDMFEKETGIKVPVDRTKPINGGKCGKECYEWLMANAREEWIDWRCRKIADWYKTLAKHLRDARSDLKLGINCMVPILYEESHFDTEGTERDFWGEINREMGIDARYFADVPNIFIDQTVFPADYRWTENRKSDAIRARLRNTEEYAGMYTTLMPMSNAWVHHHDRYWESAIGKDASVAMTASWLKEHPWRVSTLNPTGFYAMKHYVMPLKYKDILGITKGGFLIGTYGMETHLVAFSAAFRALPAVEFSDCDALSTDDVKVRTWSNGKYTWYYAVNTSMESQKVVIPLQAGASTVIDLARNVRCDVKDGALTVKLAPYSLRSFRMKQ